MAELATLARPYAEALFKAVSVSEAQSAATQLSELAQVASDERLKAFADNPRTTVDQVFEVVTSATKTVIGVRVKNLLRVVIENGRTAALPEIATQFKALVNAQSGSSDAVVYSAFPIDPGVAGANWAQWKFVNALALDPLSVGTVFSVPPTPVERRSILPVRATNFALPAAECARLEGVVLDSLRQMPDWGRRQRETEHPLHAIVTSEWYESDFEREIVGEDRMRERRIRKIAGLPEGDTFSESELRLAETR